MYDKACLFPKKDCYGISSEVMQNQFIECGLKVARSVSPPQASFWASSSTSLALSHWRLRQIIGAAILNEA